MDATRTRLWRSWPSKRPSSGQVSLRPGGMTPDYEGPRIEYLKWYRRIGLEHRTDVYFQLCNDVRHDRYSVLIEDGDTLTECQY
jgi:hypothetical protein